MMMLAVLFTLSGGFSLVYQLVWTRWAGLVLGHFAWAQATVLATIMAGLAAGNVIVGRRVSGFPPARALRMYALLEAGLAVLAAASPLAFAGAGSFYEAVAPSMHGVAVRAAWCAVLLLPPTILMGGTLPAIVQAAGAFTPGPLARFYALNTLGAAAGPVLAAFALMPVIGIRGTLWLACALNAAVAAAAWKLAERMEGGVGGGAEVAPESEIPGYVLVLAACSGLVALGFEVAVTRLVTLTITRTSVYGFAVVLSAFLLGIGAGAWVAKRRPPEPGGALLAFAAAQAVGCAWAFLPSFWDLLVLGMLRFWEAAPGFGPRMLVDALVTAAVLLPLPAAFGYALPALAAVPGRVSATSVGRLFAANTAGAVAGSLIAGFLLLPLLGLSWTIRVLGTGSLLLAAWAAWRARPEWGRRLAAAAALAVVALAAGREPDPVTMDAGLNLRPRRDILAEAREGRASVVFRKDGMAGRVSVISAGGELIFSIDGAPNASNSQIDLLTQASLAYLPAMAAENPSRALVIGLGAGITAGNLSVFPGIARLDVAEIEPAQPGVAAVFRDNNHDVMKRPGVFLHLDDARHFLLTGRETWDVISHDPADLFVSGMANLYTIEFYRLARARLAPGGAIVEYLHAYHLASPELRGILRTALEVFPNAGLFVQPHGDLLLLATDRPFVIDLERWDWLARDAAVAGDLARAGISSGTELAGLFVWGPGDLARYTEGARLCTDADPFPEFTTPRRPFSLHAQNLLGMEVALFGPLDPAPLAKETAAVRLRLARLAFSHGFVARARTECMRSLALAPGNGRAEALLKEINALEASARRY